MHEDEKKLVQNLTDQMQETGKRVTKMMYLICIVVVVLIIGQTVTNISHSITISKIEASNAKMMESIVNDYFYSAYDYGEITQTTDVKVGD